jgi:pantetheine-phosphate adenylyltransferase
VASTGAIIISDPSLPRKAMPARRYSTVATGGTFDGLHAGHKHLLERSFELGDAVVIGLTSDEFARKQGKAPGRSYEERERDLEAYIARRFPRRRHAIAKLDDFFGPGIASREVEALVASPETAKRVENANSLRASRGFPPLELVVVDWVLAHDGTPISSTRIRGGEIDEDGRPARGRRKTANSVPP